MFGYKVKGNNLSLYAFITAIIVVYILGIFPFLRRIIFFYFSFIPSKFLFSLQIWRGLTYAFIHGNSFHLLFNVLSLWWFGREIEERWGTRRFVVFFFYSALFSALISLLTVFFYNPLIIGSSGVILALLTVYAFYFPEREILIFFLFPVKVKYAVIIFGAVSLLGALQTASGIAHITHLGGILAGFLYIKYYDKLIDIYIHYRAVNAEKKMRKNAEKKIKQDEFIKNSVDPVLKKISKHGEKSLTRDEKKILEKASRILNDKKGYM